MAAQDRMTKQEAIRRIEEQQRRLIRETRAFAATIRGAQEQFVQAVLDISVSLKAIAEELPNRSPIRRSPRVSPRVTPEIAEQVRRLALDNPTMSNHEIAAQLGLNQGRVSEILAGRRT
jgi:hypothetical protein